MNCDTCIHIFNCPNESIKQKRLEALKQLGRGYGFEEISILESLDIAFPCDNYENYRQRFQTRDGFN